VTAENGYHQKTYYLNIERKSSSSRRHKETPQTESPWTQNNGILNYEGTPDIEKSSGKASVRLSSDDLNDAFDNASPDDTGIKKIKVNVPKVRDADGYETVLPADSITRDEENNSIEINTQLGSVTLPSDMMDDEDINGAENVSLSVSIADREGIDQETLEQIGDRPVIQLEMKADGKSYAWSNPDAPVTVSIPYTPTAEELEDPEHITVWYIDGAGNVVEVPSGRYDPETGRVTFSTTHFSHYAVAYVKKTFDDIDSVSWAKEQIEVLASKGILRGISETKYSPQTDITRADFLYFLVRTLGVNTTIEKNFEDIDDRAYYYDEIAIAKELGITKGTGNNRFNPDANITRQDMMVLTERALRMLKMIEVQGAASDLKAFSDKSLIASYAVESIASLVKEGLIIGSGDKIDPLGYTTRAEAAVFLYRIYNK